MIFLFFLFFSSHTKLGKAVMYWIEHFSLHFPPVFPQRTNRINVWFPFFPFELIGHLSISLSFPRNSLSPFPDKPRLQQNSFQDADGRGLLFKGQNGDYLPIVRLLGRWPPLVLVITNSPPYGFGIKFFSHTFHPNLLKV